MEAVSATGRLGWDRKADRHHADGVWAGTSASIP